MTRQKHILNKTYLKSNKINILILLKQLKNKNTGIKNSAPFVLFRGEIIRHLY